MTVDHRSKLIFIFSVLALPITSGCSGSDDMHAGASSALEADTGPNQVLGDNFIQPPNETALPEPGPDPALCFGATEATSAETPFGAESDDGTPSYDWALTDFQPQSCAFESTYGLQGFQGEVTLVALLAAW